MKLYDVPRPCGVLLLEDAQVPPGCRPLLKGETLFFDHIDGMYSYCRDKDGCTVHPAAFTEVELT